MHWAISTGQNFFARDGLASAFESFSGYSIDDIPPEDLPFFGSFHNHGQQPAKLASTIDISVTQRLPIGQWGRTQITRNLSASVVKRKFHLPKGFGIFRDPTDFRFTALNLSGDVELSRDWARWRKVKARSSLALGVAIAHVHTEINSALLDIDGNTNSSTAYLRFGTGLTFGQRAGREGLDMRLTVTGYTNGYPDLALEASKAF